MISVRACVVTGVGLLAAACRRGPPAASLPRLVEVRVVDRTPAEVAPQPPPLDLRDLTARAAAAIGAATRMAIVDGGAAAAGDRRLRVEVRLEGVEDATSGKGLMRAFVLARVQPVAETGLTFEQAAMAERVYELKKAGDPSNAWRAHAARAVEDVVRGVAARVRLADGDAHGVVVALNGADEDLQKEAIRLAGERRNREAVPALLGLLKKDDRELRDGAIGALAAIGDRRAIKPLTEVARFRDLTDLPVVLDALAAIGGDEARAYLEFVASGHDNAEMRDLAKQALVHLTARNPEK